jgi:predicted transcriptional regulator
LIAEIYGALGGLGKVGDPSEALGGITKATPAQIRKSVTETGIVSFEDGKPYTSMKRHLAKYGLTPQAYRAKWGLPVDYPMVTARYSASRSALAKARGLGIRVKAVIAPVAAVANASKGPGRPRKAASKAPSASTAIDPADDTFT